MSITRCIKVGLFYRKKQPICHISDRSPSTSKHQCDNTFFTIFTFSFDYLTLKHHFFLSGTTTYMSNIQWETHTRLTQYAMFYWLNGWQFVASHNRLINVGILRTIPGFMCQIIDTSTVTYPMVAKLSTIEFQWWFDKQHCVG